MHHASFPHKYDKPPSHALSLPREGALTELFRKEFPDAYFDEKTAEWRLDWDEKQFPHQGQRLDVFAAKYDLEIEHRY